MVAVKMAQDHVGGIAQGPNDGPAHPAATWTGWGIKPLRR